MTAPRPVARRYHREAAARCGRAADLLASVRGVAAPTVTNVQHPPC